MSFNKVVQSSQVQIPEMEAAYDFLIQEKLQNVSSSSVSYSDFWNYCYSSDIFRQEISQISESDLLASQKECVSTVISKKLPETKTFVCNPDKKRLTLINELDLQIQMEEAFQSLLGKSSAIKKLKRDLFLVKDKNCKVLFTGETGCGKTLSARILHQLSPYRKNKFVVVNICSLHKDLVETSLFGSVKGAYTDAPDRKGFISLAEGGTVLLDEIGELTPECQTKLLRLLDEGVYRKVGSDREEHSDARFIFATNADLQTLVEENRFREDLYWRIKECEIKIPSLREREGDSLILAEHFLAEKNFSISSGKRYFSSSAREKILSFSWPGNVRQLQSCINTAVDCSMSERIDAEDIITV